MGFVGGGGVNAVHYATAQVNFFRIKTLVVKSTPVPVAY